MKYDNFKYLIEAIQNKMEINSKHSDTLSDTILGADVDLKIICNDEMEYL